MDLQLFATLSMGLLGILFGSFSNVCVHRIPLGQSIVTPGSHCPQCKNDIAWYDNIPLISWVLLGRKCRHCNLAISWRYPLLELSMGGLWALITWFTPIAPQTSVYLLQAIVLVSLLWILTLIDLETFLLPNALTFPGIASGLLFAWHFDYLLDALIGVISGYGFFWLIAFLFYKATGKEGMGQGDFKLLAMLGAFMGWQALPFIVLVSSVVGAIIGSIILLLQRKGLRSEIPFGPYLAMASVVWFFFGTQI